MSAVRVGPRRAPVGCGPAVAMLFATLGPVGCAKSTTPATEWVAAEPIATDLPAPDALPPLEPLLCEGLGSSPCRPTMQPPMEYPGSQPVAGRLDGPRLRLLSWGCCDFFGGSAAAFADYWASGHFGWLAPDPDVLRSSAGSAFGRDGFVLVENDYRRAFVAFVDAEGAPFRRDGFTCLDERCCEELLPAGDDRYVCASTSSVSFIDAESATSAEPIVGATLFGAGRTVARAAGHGMIASVIDPPGEGRRLWLADRLSAYETELVMDGSTALVFATSHGWTVVTETHIGEQTELHLARADPVGAVVSAPRTIATLPFRAWFQGVSANGPSDVLVLMQRARPASPVLLSIGHDGPVGPFAETAASRSANVFLTRDGCGFVLGWSAYCGDDTAPCLWLQFGACQIE